MMTAHGLDKVMGSLDDPQTSGHETDGRRPGRGKERSAVHGR